jgi:hypothetical protein
VVGVHTPEFAFEHDPGNVAEQATALGVRYPVAVDNDYATWNAYGNHYWPAAHLVDATGRIRRTSFGEGGYAEFEQQIRAALTDAGAHRLPPATDVPDTTPDASLTTETYVAATLVRRTAPDAGDLDPFLLVLRSAPNPRAAEILRAGIEKHVERHVLDVAPALSGTERAAMAPALINDFWLMRKVIGSTALNETDETTLKDTLERLFRVLLGRPARPQSNSSTKASPAAGPASRKLLSVSDRLPPGSATPA